MSTAASVHSLLIASLYLESLDILLFLMAISPTNADAPAITRVAYQAPSGVLLDMPPEPNHLTGIDPMGTS